MKGGLGRGAPGGERGASEPGEAFDGSGEAEELALRVREADRRRRSAPQGERAARRCHRPRGW